MKINVSGPHSLNYMKLMDMAQAVLDSPSTIISDMRFGAANGVGGMLHKHDSDEPDYKYYLYITKGQITIDIQEVEEKKEESEDGEHSV